MHNELDGKEIAAAEALNAGKTGDAQLALQLPSSATTTAHDGSNTVSDAEVLKYYFDNLIFYQSH